MNTQSHRILLQLLTVLWSVSGSVHAAFSSMVVLGDSLSDQGNVYQITYTNPFLPLIPPPEYTDGTNVGRFTNGLNYIDYLSASLNLSVLPSQLGGTNYATGGARTDSASFGGIPIGPYSLLDQRDAYINSLGPSGIEPGTLHVVYGGSNDVLDIIDTIITDPSFNTVLAVQNTIANIVDIIDSLAAANARSILVPYVPNLGLVPLITDGGAPVTEATELSALFNLGLSNAIDTLSAGYPETRLFEFDVFNLFTDAYMNPADYGFTNVNEGCYSLFVETGGTTCANPSEYLSWDGLHPTTAAHEIFAANVVVPIPAALWLFVSGAVALLALTRRRRW